MVPFERPSGYPNSISNSDLNTHLNELAARRASLVESPQTPHQARLMAGILERDQVLRTGEYSVTPEISDLYRREAENANRHFNSSGPSPVNRDPLDVAEAYANYASTLPAGNQRDAALAKAAEYRGTYSSSDAYRREQTRISEFYRRQGSTERVSSASVHAEDFRDLRGSLSEVRGEPAKARIRAQMEAIAIYAREQGWNMQYFNVR